MITLRGIGVFIFSALLTGSPAYSAVSPSEETPKCLAPGAVQPTDTKCYYVLTITKIGDGGRVTGKVAKSVLGKNKRDNPDFPIDKYKHREFEFHVKDLPKLSKGSDYVFDGVPGTSDLSCRTPCEPQPPELK